ncbi:protein kinase with cyclin box [Cedratvirus kamchatka]|uniref:Protein kinase with cyclin box n=1 Tax=Cedratvirus kamchatka TaxID=2716914 RepID=A0A6G8MZD8_9VIRU|nr:protein kinase with cyclin box [Cedratvirus kamchatka]
MYGNYRVIKELDSGSYGRVYKVKSLSEGDGQEYALKEFYKPEDYSGIPSPSEISLLFSFSCNKIVKALEFFREEDRYYLLMELGQDNMINHICDIFESEKETQRDFLQGDLVKSYCRDVACAVDYMHSGGFAHCDIKPANCLLFGKEVKLCDLGFSFLIKSNLVYPITPAFSPPETLHEDVESILEKRQLSFLSYFTQEKDYRAVDVWSLAVTFAFFLTGRYLFGNVNKEETLNNMITYIRYPVNYLTQNGVPEEWIPLLLKMLRPCSQERITIKQVLQDNIFTSLDREAVHTFHKLEPLLVPALAACPLIDQGRDFIYSFFAQNKPGSCMALSTLNAFYYVCSQRPELKEKANLLAFACLLLFSKVYARYVVDESEFVGEHTLEEIVDMEWQVMQTLNKKIFFSTLASELGEEKTKYSYLFQKEYTGN